MFKKLFIGAALVAGVIGITGCQRDAQTASYNLSQAADMFEVDRRVIFYNGITDKYMFSVEGKCSINVDRSDAQLEVTCKVGQGEFKKHYLGLSDNVSYVVEQLESKGVSVYHHRIVFKPQSIIPDADLNVDTRELNKDRY